MKPSKKSPPKLSDRQRRFCEFVAAGHALSVAYEKAGYKGGESNAYRLMGIYGVTKYLEELRKPQKETAVATRQRKREILFEIMEGKRTVGADASIRAIQADNLMTGDNKPIKVEGEITLKRVLDAIGGNLGPGVDNGDFE